MARFNVLEGAGKKAGLFENVFFERSGLGSMNFDGVAFTSLEVVCVSFRQIQLFELFSIHCVRNTTRKKTKIV